MTSSTSSTSLRRSDVSYVNKCSRFTFDGEKHDYERQFNDLYHARLDSLRKRISDAAARQWGSDVPVRKLTDLYENKDECVIIGTIYKLQELKPSVLKEIADEAHITPQPVRALKFTTENDKCILEDENLRVNLTGEYKYFDHGQLMTGVTLGVCGLQEEGGSFKVTGMCFAEPPALPPPLTVPSGFEQDDRYVLMLSGLNFRGEKEGDEEDAVQTLYCRLLADWITGRVGEEDELSKISRIVRVIVAGGSISEKCHCDGREYGQIARYRSRKTAPPSVEAVRLLDNFLHDILLSVDVDLMPGEHDPTNHMLPQQPWHRCLLPKSIERASLHQCTNPYAAEIGGVSFLGTSGQNIDDVLKYTTVVDSVSALKSTLKWCHLCPSAPDTLDCYPFYNADPFVIDGEMPHVYFAGNQPDLKSDLLVHENDGVVDNGNGDDGIRGKTLLLSLPKFGESGVCALVNLRTLHVEPIVFAADELFGGKDHHENGSCNSSIEIDTDDETPLNSVLSTPVYSGTPDLFS